MRPLPFALAAAALAAAATVADAGGIDHRTHGADAAGPGAEVIAALLALEVGPPGPMADALPLGPSARAPGPEVTLAHHKRRKARAKDRWVPWHCVRKVGKHRRVVGKRCLRRNYPWLRLPRHCLTEVWHRGHWRYAYGLRCLRHKGYRVI